MSKAQEEFELEENLLENPRLDTSSAVNNPQHYPHTINYKDEIIIITSPNWRESHVLKLQILFAFFVFVIIGLADQALGTLLPTLITHYGTKQGKITFVFMLQFMGYSIAAIANNLLHLSIGRRGVIVIATLFLMIAFGVNSMQPRLWIYVVMHSFYGLGVGLLDSCLNVLLSSVVDNNELMGLLHGFYGFGSILSPPFISWILKTSGNKFGYFYLTLFIMACFGGLSGAFIFKNETRRKYEWSIQDDSRDKKQDGDVDNDADDIPDLGFWSLVKDRFILANCGYLFLYVGTEISIGSWLLTYLIRVKDLKQMSASLIVSWFWIGLTVGRMCLGFVTRIFKNEYRANLFYSLASLVCYIIYTIYTLSFNSENFKWFTMFNILLIFTCGVFIGPLFPTSNINLMNCLPSKLHVLAVGIMSSLGGTGSAILPFLVGHLTEWTRFELLPVYITLIIIGYCALWLALPRLTTKIISYEF